MLDTVVRWLLDWAEWIVAALGVAAATFSAWFAYRSARASEKSAEVAERAVRVSKLPSVERVLEDFRKLVPKLRESPTARIKQVDRLAQDARVIASESLGPPFERLRAALQQLPPRRARGTDSWGHPRSANRPVGEEDWATVQECIDGVYTALEEFINR